MIYVTNSNLISNCRYRFRRLHSTSTTLLETVDSWAYNMIQVVWMPMFDTVVYDILLSKLNAYGIIRVLDNWFKSYLKDC